MDLSKLGMGERIAAGAAALLFIDLFLDWYGVDLGGVFGGVAGVGIDTSASAWSVFSFTDVFLFAIILATLGLTGLHAAGSGPSLPVSRSAIIAGLGALATVLVFWRLVNQPGPNKIIDVKFGAYLGFLLSAGIAFGGWRAMRAEGVSITDARGQAKRAVSGLRGGGPPPPSSPDA
jgi:hypothetical protein